MSGDRAWAAVLRAACERPAQVAAAWRAGGGQVVGLLGWSAPRELVVAAGLLPVRLSPDRIAGPDGVPGSAASGFAAAGPDGVPGAAAAGFGRQLTPGTARLAAALLSGALDWIDFLLIGRDCEAHTKLFYVLRELRRSGAAAELPPVAFFDLLRLPSHTSARYNRQRAAELTAVIAAWAGRPVTPADLAGAVEAAGGTAHSFGSIQALRTRPRPAITGTDALAAAIAAQILPVSQLRPLLDAALAASPPDVPFPGAALPGAALPGAALPGAISPDGALPDGSLPHGPLPYGPLPRGVTPDVVAPAARVFLAGSAVDDLSAYEALEGLGLAVVGEDHEWGDDGSEPPAVTRDPLDGIVDRYQFAHGGAARAGLAERVGQTVARISAARAGGVLYLLGPHDEAVGWELSLLRECLGADKPLIPVRLAAQERPGGDHQEIREAGRRLLAELSAASGAGEAGRG